MWYRYRSNKNDHIPTKSRDQLSEVYTNMDNCNQIWENDPNITSVKVKLTPPMDSYTNILLVRTLKLL